jgi:osmotically inducible protein OsmC
MRLRDGHELAFSRGSRFEGQAGSSPEELIGAALSGCFSMALASALTREGMEPEQIETRAVVSLGREVAGFAIDKIQLFTSARIPDADPLKFEMVARAAKESCPVAKALVGTTVTLDARLEGRA